LRFNARAMQRAILAAEAAALGLELVGSVPIAPLPSLTADRFRRWLAEGRAGAMRYLERRTATRLDPHAQFPWARSFLVVALPYRPAPAPGDWRTLLRGRVAAYAVGDDYHHTVQARLDRLADRLRDRFPGSRHLSYVDTGAILEREWAHRAGLGWIGRNTLLLHPDVGSYVLLGELVTSLEVEPEPIPADRCGTCTRCVTACPTDALDGDYTIDPRRCISYLTIELRTAIPRALRPQMANWIFGCDACQTVCPWNATDGDAETAAFLHPPLLELLALDDAAFAARFAGTALTRAGRSGLLRNVAVALGNSGNPDAVPALAHALADPDALVRAHVAWALGRLGTAPARRALDQARHREPVGDVGTEIAAALAGDV
jgi:epoxyqueuosine reductase